MLDWLPGRITESLLISAYDLHYGALAHTDRLLDGSGPTPMHEPEFLMVDSGRYEADQRPPVTPDGDEMPCWTPEMMLDVYRRLPEDLAIALVNWDEQNVGYQEQVARARSLFADLPGRASVVLLKPEDPRRFIEPAKIGAIADELRAFTIVGVTEKELGTRLGQRLRTLADLRRVLDEQDVDAPLHVFGGLDPLMTPLYVMCGAEIVDGVGWLRYAYVDDAAHYMENRALFDLHLDAKVPERILYTVNDNLLYLSDLKRRLRRLVTDGDLRAFSEERGGVLAKLWDRVAIDAGEA